MRMIRQSPLRCVAATLLLFTACEVPETEEFDVRVAAGEARQPGSLNGKEIEFNPAEWAPKGYEFKHVKMGVAANYTIGAALASAAANKLDLASRIRYEGGNWYSVLLHEFGWVRTFFDGRVDPADFQPTVRKEMRSDGDGQTREVVVLETYWPLLFARAYTTKQAEVNWEKPQADDTHWKRQLRFPITGSWQSPKNAGFAIGGGDKNNWDTDEGDDAISHLRRNLELGSVCMVDERGTTDRDSNTERTWAIVSMRKLENGSWHVHLYHPSGDEKGLTWPEFQHAFKTITMVTRAGVEY
jgi:hypothetical protein